MNHKKIVIFHVNSQEQFFGEFHENTKIKMIKSFFRDVSHYNKFKLIYNGSSQYNDEMNLKEMIKGSNIYEILIKVALQNMNQNSSQYLNSENEMNFLNENNPTLISNNLNVNSYPNLTNFPQNNEELIKENYVLKSRNNELESQMNFYKEENLNLNNLISELNNKVQIAQKAYDTGLMQLLSHQKTIEQMQIDYNDLQNNFNTIKVNLERYQQQYSNAGRRTSNLSNTVSFDFGLNKRKSNFGQNVPQNINENKIEKEMENKNEFYNNINNNLLIPNSNVIKSSSTRKSISSNSVTSRKSVVIKELGPASKKKSILVSNNSVSSITTGISQFNNEIKKNESSANIGLSKSYSIEMLNKSNTKLINFRPIKSDPKSHWNKILSYMSPNDQLNLCLTNKEKFKNVAYFWYDLIYAKIENINNTLQLNKKHYDNILETTQFQLSQSANTALKILNNSKYLEIFNNLNSHFDNYNFLPIYLLLFQIVKIFSDVELGNSNQNNEFISKFKSFFIEKSEEKGLGELMKSLPKLCDFSENNIQKIKEIMKFYNITTIDCGALGKLCKTTGIISFFLKDALVYCGIDAGNDKKVKEEKDKDRVGVFKDNIDIKELKVKNEKILGNLEETFKKFNFS